MSAPLRPGSSSSALPVFQILRLVSSAEDPLGVAEISRRLAIPTTSVHRALVLLEQAQYLTRIESGPRYELGPMPQTLARALFRRFPVREAGRAVLRRIAEQSGDTTALIIRLGWCQVRVAVAYGSNDLYSLGRLGEVALLQSGPAGRSILAALPEREVARYGAFIDAHHSALAGELASRSFQRELASARERGFAAEPLPQAGGHEGIAMPLRGADGAAVGAILVSAADDRPPGGRPSWARLVDELGATLRASPELSHHPYAHLDPDEVTANLPYPEAAGSTRRQADLSKSGSP